MTQARVVYSEKEATAFFAELKEQRKLRETREMVEAMKDEEVARTLVGDCWFQPHGAPSGDGRQRYSVHDAEGAMVAILFGEEEAERACEQLISTGKISR